jgi:hypothetical protein
MLDIDRLVVRADGTALRPPEGLLKLVRKTISIHNLLPTTSQVKITITRPEATSRSAARGQMD